ncbi:MAG TPA: hypothetical protein VK021_02255 [Flavobacteriaceae bacterium]|nr:hypothetical protein [Flavobacteriaceae bacterium]
MPSSIDLSLEDNWIYDLGNLYGYGQFKIGKYMACDLTYNEVVYKYKVGYWKFWNLNRELIAKGKFNIDSTTITDRGGCDFTIKMSNINKDNWTFYNGNGQKTEPTIEQLYRIKNAEN